MESKVLKHQDAPLVALGGGVSRRVLATLLVEETEPAAAQDAYGGVAAANAALGRAIERIVALVVAEGAAMRP